MKTVILFLALFLPPVRAEIRTFRNTKGQEIKAEIMSATATHAELKLENGKRSKVALTLLSEADRQWITEWAKTHKHFKLQVAATVKKGNTREEEGDANAGGTKGNDCWYEISLKNTAGEVLAGLRVEYITFAPSGASQCGGADVPAIPAGMPGRVQTEKLFVPQAVQTMRTEVGRGGTGASITRTVESSLAGLHAEMYIDGRLAGSFVSGKLPEDAAQQLQAWREKNAPAPAKPAEKQ